MNPPNNNLQIIGTLLDCAKVVGGGLITLGLLHITADQLTLYITTGGAMLAAIAGAAAVLYPIGRSIYYRTRVGALSMASANLRPGETIVLGNHVEAAKLPDNVVGPPAKVVDPAPKVD